MAPGVAGHALGTAGLGTAGSPGSSGKSCPALVIQVVTCFVKQEKLGSVGLSPHNTQQPTHEARFYMDALPYQTFSTVIKLVKKNISAPSQILPGKIHTALFK